MGFVVKGVFVVGVYLSMMCVHIDSVQFLLYPVTIPGGGAGLRTGSLISPTSNVQFQLSNSKQGTYHFGYDSAGETHKSYREEKREANGKVVGRYGYISPEGIWNRVEYEADERGYRTKTSNSNINQQVYYEPTEIQVIGPIPKPFSEFYNFQ